MNNTEDQDLTIYQSQIITLIGKNGSSKSTLIEELSGINSTTNMLKIKAWGVSIKEPLTYQSLIGKRLESMTFFEFLTVKENLNLYSALKELDKDKSQANIQQVINLMNLKSCLDKQLSNLS